MDVKEFLEKYNYAPYEFREIVELVSEISDNEEMTNMAKTFLDARENLEMMLDGIGFEFG